MNSELQPPQMINFEGLGISIVAVVSMVVISFEGITGKYNFVTLGILGRILDGFDGSQGNFESIKSKSTSQSVGDNLSMNFLIGDVPNAHK